MTLLNTLAPPPTPEAAETETPAVDGRSDEPTGRSRLVARWTADARPTATWSVE